MTRRVLYIIISMLVLIDVLAGLYYIGARLDSRTVTAGTTPPPASVDTMMVESVPDVVEPLRHISRVYIASDDEGKRHACALEVNLRRLVSVNGNDSLDALDRAIAGAAFGTPGTTLAESIGEFLDTPWWGNHRVGEWHIADVGVLRAAGVDVSRVNVDIAPCMTSLRLLVVRCRRARFTTTDTTTVEAFVHYDRLTQRVLQRNDILLADAEQQLLQLINAKIDRLNSEKHLDLTTASRVPASFRAMRAGLLFNFAEGELASVSRGGIEVLVDYKVLGPCLTSSFKHLLWNNDNYTNNI